MIYIAMWAFICKSLHAIVTSLLCYAVLLISITCTACASWLLGTLGGVYIIYQLSVKKSINSLRPRLNRRPFADDIFKCIFSNENEWFSPRISLKFVPKVRINNIPALVQIMAWRRPGDKPLSEPVMVSLLTHICVTRPQWVKTTPRETKHIG